MVTDVDFSSRRNLLVTASGDSAFKLWDISKGLCTQTIDWASGAVNHCMFVRVEDEELLITCHFDVKFGRSRILLWNMDGKSGWADGKLVSHAMHFEGFKGKITCIDTAVDLDGESVLLAAGSSDGTVGVYDLTCKACLFDLVDQHVPLVGVSTSVSSLQFSPDGSKLATSGVDGKIHVWNSDDGSYHMTFNGHQERITSLCWSQDGSKIASCGHDQTTKVWKTSSS
jgi:WD40 repeat protein